MIIRPTFIADCLCIHIIYMQSVCLYWPITDKNFITYTCWLFDKTSRWKQHVSSAANLGSVLLRTVQCLFKQHLLYRMNQYCCHDWLLCHASILFKPIIYELKKYIIKLLEHWLLGKRVNGPTKGSRYMCSKLWVLCLECWKIPLIPNTFKHMWSFYVLRAS